MFQHHVSRARFWHITTYFELFVKYFSFCLIISGQWHTSLKVVRISHDQIVQQRSLQIFYRTVILDI